MGFKDLSPSLQKKIAEAKATAGGTPLADGNYVLEVEQVLVAQKYKGVFFTLEARVVESEAVRKDVEPNMPGSSCTPIHCNLDTNESAPGNMKACIFALLGLGPETSNEVYLKEVERVTSEAQPLRGALVCAETYRKTTQKGPNAGKEGCYPKFIHVEQTEAEIAARRKVLDSK